MKKSTRVLLIFIIIASLAVFVGTLVHALWYAPEASIYVPANVPTREATPEEQPDRLIIPKLDIDAHVQYVGLTASGAMGIPSNFTDVAWYKYGPAPGFNGSAVMDGHVDNGLALAGVFKHLVDLLPGDDVYVRRKDGTELHFVVRAVETYDYKAVPSERVFNRADGAYLNLITCDGKWVKTDKTYNERLVVYTELVS